MGQEISSSSFSPEDFSRFRERLLEETELLRGWFESGAFSGGHGVAGFELEAWLVDADMAPFPINHEYLEALGNPLAGSELAMFNIELNTIPCLLKGKALSSMHAELEAFWSECREMAEKFGADLVTIGILPTLKNGDLTPENMSRMKRYRAINDQALAMRSGSPFALDIEGRERLRVTHTDVMLEAATTSMQLQFQVDFGSSAAFYNAALILSAPMVAISANSPYMFSADLWDETRIQVFEQSLAEAPDRVTGFCGPNRVTFGCGYASGSLAEFFTSNIEDYRILLPMLFDDPPESFSHLRLHNGTIWRWNRPLIGFDEGGMPHLRIEHRVMPAGPTILDMMANAAFFFGLIQSYGTMSPSPETRIPFNDARENFYAAARNGLPAKIKWMDGKEIRADELILGELLPMARKGLEAFGLDGGDVERYLGIIAGRAATGRNGAAWQRAYVARYGYRGKDLVAAYLAMQHEGKPVHEWPV